METLATLFASIDYHDPVWIAVAYLFGFIVWQIGLPPLVGFLIAGYFLNALGASGGEFLNKMADLGVTLLLFTIGLKLNVRQLLRPEIWGVATAHMMATALGIAGIILLLSGTGLPLMTGMEPSIALLVGFALSFSSTVFAVKVFEEKGGLGSHYGRVAIGVLIVQDIAAVVFLAASTAKVPSPWAAAIIVALILAKPLLVALLKRAGHGELLVLFGLVLALGGSALFELVSLKGDLGALFFGVLLAHHPKSAELAKALLSLKDLFLVGFFLSIGMAAMPTLQTSLMATCLLLLVPVKILLFFLLFTRFHLRVRTAMFSSLSLGNFSEFGLIVAAIAVSNQWLSSDWLAVIALAVVLSFILASPLNVYNSAICRRFCHHLQKIEHGRRLPGDDLVHLGSHRALVCGMGRIGGGAYDQLQTVFRDAVVGVDFDEEKISLNRSHGRQIIQGDAGNPDFWQRVERKGNQLELVMLCMPNHEANVNAARAIREWGYRGQMTAVTKFSDERELLHKAGVDSTFNMYAEVGTGFAEHSLNKLGQRVTG
jgi:predicted Kef-type K+ transport protein